MESSTSLKGVFSCCFGINYKVKSTTPFGRHWDDYYQYNSKKCGVIVDDSGKITASSEKNAFGIEVGQSLWRILPGSGVRSLEQALSNTLVPLTTAQGVKTVRVSMNASQKSYYWVELEDMTAFQQTLDTTAQQKDQKVMSIVHDLKNLVLAIQYFFNQLSDKIHEMDKSLYAMMTQLNEGMGTLNGGKNSLQTNTKIMNQSLLHRDQVKMAAKVNALLQYTLMHMVSCLTAFKTDSNEKERAILMTWHKMVDMIETLCLANSLFKKSGTYTVMCSRNSEPPYRHSDVLRSEDHNELMIPASLISKLNNLISNAFKFMNDHGHVTVHIKYDFHSHLMSMFVENTGDGVAPKMLQNMGTKIMSSDTKAHGMGMGLVGLMHYVKSFNGELLFENVYDKQTVTGFCAAVKDINLKELQRQKSQQKRHLDRIRATREVFKKYPSIMNHMHCYGCEGDAFQRDLLTKQFKSFLVPLLLHEHSDAADTSVGPIDVIISDNHMGSNRRTGVNFAKERQNKQAPFILLSADACNSRNLSGVDYILQKPLSPNALTLLFAGFLCQPRWSNQPFVQQIKARSDYEMFQTDMMATGIHHVWNDPEGYSLYGIYEVS
jgi:signal transduction histidine kinase